MVGDWLYKNRVFPRIFGAFYLWLTYETAMWFMTLPDPSTEQAAFASTVMATSAAYFKFYVDTGGD